MTNKSTSCDIILILEVSPVTPLSLSWQDLGCSLDVAFRASKKCWSQRPNYQTVAYMWPPCSLFMALLYIMFRICFVPFVTIWLVTRNNSKHFLNIYFLVIRYCLEDLIHCLITCLSSFCVLKLKIKYRVTIVVTTVTLCHTRRVSIAQWRYQKTKQFFHFVALV